MDLKKKTHLFEWVRHEFELLPLSLYVLSNTRVTEQKPIFGPERDVWDIPHKEGAPCDDPVNLVGSYSILLCLFLHQGDS